MRSLSNPIQNAMFVIYVPAFKANTCNIIQTNRTIFISIVKGLAIHPVIFDHLILHMRLWSLIHYVNLQTALLSSEWISKTSKAALEAISDSRATISDAITDLPKITIFQSTNNTNDYHQTNYTSNN